MARLLTRPAPAIETVLRLPPPPSVNRTRRIDWRGAKKHKAWMAEADMAVMAHGLRKLAKMPGPFEVHILLDRTTRFDIDNGLKALCDYCRRIGLIIDDGPQYMLGLHVTRGDAPSGCTLTLRSIDADSYNADDDFAKSLDVAYSTIRERVANGGKPWKPKEPK